MIWYHDQQSFDTADSVTVTVGNTTSDVNAVLARNGNISGKVIDEAGSGIEKISVYAYDSSDNSRYHAGLTDSNGEYTVSDLPAGSYKLKFFSLEITDSSGNLYLKEWYNDKQSFETADSVAVTSGDTTSDVNVTLAVGGNISGKVTDEAGNGIAEVYFYVYDSSDKYITVGYGMTDSNGDYTVNTLPAGSCKIEFSNWRAIDANGNSYAGEWYNDILKPLI